MREVTPDQVKEIVQLAVELNLVTYVAGPAAIGKSEVMAQVAEDLNLYMLDVRLSQRLPEDLNGMPYIINSGEKAGYVPFDTFPIEGDKVPDGYDGWMLFMDELSSASQENLAAAYSILLDHMVGGKKLHKRCRVVAAGNRSTDSAIAEPLPDTIITRLLMVTMKVSSKSWITWSETRNKYKSPEVTEFIRKYPDMLYSAASSDTRTENEQYETPRGWGKACKIVSAFIKRNAETKVRQDIPGVTSATDKTELIIPPIGGVWYNLIEGVIGITGAKSFVEYFNDSLQLPYPWDIAISPASTMIPPTQIAQARLTEDIANYYKTADEGVRGNLLQYMARMGRENHRSFVMHIENIVGNTKSDRDLLDSIKTRLGVVDADLDLGDDLPQPSVPDKPSATNKVQPAFNP